MDSKVVIRKGRLSDVPKLVELLKDLFSIEEDFHFDQKKQETGLKMLLESDPDYKILLVAVSKGKVIGMCSAQSLISTAEGAKSAMIEDMVIDGSMRGKGVGKLIMNEIVSWAEKIGATRLQLLTDKNNSRAISFYKKNNWEDTQLICLKRTKI